MPGPSLLRSASSWARSLSFGRLTSARVANVSELCGVVEPAGGRAARALAHGRGGCGRAARTARCSTLCRPVWRTARSGWSTVRMPCAAGAQAQVHVLGPQVDASSNGPSVAERPSARRGRRRPPSRRCAAAWPRNGSARRGSDREQRGDERPERARERVRAALDAPVAVEQARRVQPAGRGRAGRACASASSTGSVSGLRRTVMSSVTCSSASVARGAEAGVVAALDHRRRRARRASVEPPSSGPLSTTTSSRAARQHRQQRARARHASGAGRSRPRSSHAPRRR